MPCPSSGTSTQRVISWTPLDAANLWTSSLALYCPRSSDKRLLPLMRKPGRSWPVGVAAPLQLSQMPVGGENDERTLECLPTRIKARIAYIPTGVRRLGA